MELVGNVCASSRAWRCHSSVYFFSYVFGMCKCCFFLLVLQTFGGMSIFAIRKPLAKNKYCPLNFFIDHKASAMCCIRILYLCLHRTFLSILTFLFLNIIGKEIFSLMIFDAPEHSKYKIFKCIWSLSTSYFIIRKRDHRWKYKHYYLSINGLDFKIRIKEMFER